jgi:sulfonate transport system ATP-binding protein
MPSTQPLTAQPLAPSQGNGLRLENISKHFTHAGADTQLHVLDNVQLDIAPGEFITIVGASGCGKSTLLRLILGLDEAFDGRILLDDKPIRGTGLERGIVFQDHRLFPWLTVEQNVAVGLKNAPLSAAQKRDTVREHIQLVGLQDFTESYTHQISGGMAQRVAIARGLVNRPSVLLLDEPFGALDALTRTRLQRELQHIWQQEKITMVHVTHDVDEAVYLGDRVVVMQPHPGRMPRPRNRSDARFISLRDDVLSDFAELS